MMSTIIRLLGLIIICFIGTSCERLFFEEVPENNPKSIFEQTWKFTNEEYSFFEYKRIDWDSVYTAYEPRITDDLSDELLFDELSSMLYLLKDGHVNLRTPFDRSRNWTWYLNAPDNFDKYVLERNYFKEQQQLVGPFVIYEFDDIGYIYYGSFGDGISHGHLNLILEKFADKKGIIFDIRNNLGGSLDNVYTIGSHFVSEKTSVAKMRYKNGPAPDDFEEYFDIVFEPEEGNEHYTGPVALLTNRRSYSAGNFFPTSMGALNHVTILGDTTGGGGGVPSFTELTNGWNLRVSSSQLLTLDGVNTENGLAPDIYVEAPAATLAEGVDLILEEALILLRK